jgi:transposase
MRPLSDDLRQRILLAIDRGEHSLRQIAYLFSVNLSTIVRLLQRRRRTGSSRPKPHGGGPTPKLDEQAEQRLLERLRQRPDATLAELRDYLGIPCSLMTIARVLRRHRISRKKKTLHANERDRPDVQAQRAAFEQKLSQVEAERLVFVDETGATTAMTRLYGRAPEGERVQASAPGSWQSVTLIAGLRPTEVVAPLAFEGATDAVAFRTYVQAVLVPQLRPGDVVVWDRLQAHQDVEATRAVEAVGARVEPLPPYSPDETPIEEMFAKVKAHLRSAAARTTARVIGALGVALQMITPEDIQGWFQDRCAYAMH